MTRYFDDSDIYGIQILWTSERGIDTGSTETDEDTGSCIAASLERSGFKAMSSAGFDVETVDSNDDALKDAVFSGMDDWWSDVTHRRNGDKLRAWCRAQKNSDDVPLANENGYVIYPQSIGVMDFDAACEKARELSVDGDDTRVEDCDTEKTLARYHRGERA